jgi:succinate-semialdehyde dehydrogenase / glutarate-semialdehyde dehydrogenase
MTAVAGGRARLLIDGQWQAGTDAPFEVTDKYTGAIIGSVESAGRDQVDAAVAAARRSFTASPLDPQDRYLRLMEAARLVERQRDEFAGLITAEGGIPITDAAAEVVRAVQTLIVSAEESKRLAGEMVPIEAAPGQSHRMAFTIRVPRGVVCGITAFNSPLNMVCHKVAPALAAGNTVVVKPSELAPLTASRFFELLLEAGFPPGHLNLVHGAGARVGPWLVDNEGVDFYTFTGSGRAGRLIRERAGIRPVVLELGSISPTIVCEDADLDRAAARCAASAFRRAGQVCTSTQRVLVQRGVEAAFVDRLQRAAAALQVGDPRDPRTDVGPMISEREAIRAETWVREAVAAGATLVMGGRREGALLYPTILANVDPGLRVVCEEIFAPVVTLVPYESFDEAIALANGTPFGLAAGIFSKDITRAMTAARRLHVGLLHINDASSSRVDLMPFGGVKQSGIGREGPRYAMQEMTEERVVTFTLG